MVQCVGLWKLADYLLLSPLKSSVEVAVRKYCDKRLKQLCTIESESKWLQDDGNQDELSPWALDLVLGARDAYTWNFDVLKRILMEFLWAGRVWTLRGGIASTVLSHFKDTPVFVTDLVGHFASKKWLEDAIWAPKYGLKRNRDGDSQTCPGCKARFFGAFSEPAKPAKGQVIDPFILDRHHDPKRRWCCSCGKLDSIPWRDQRL